MDKLEEKKVFYKNYQKITDMMLLVADRIEKRQRQGEWWLNLSKDEFYKYLCGIYAELKITAIQNWGEKWYLDKDLQRMAKGKE